MDMCECTWEDHNVFGIQSHSDNPASCLSEAPGICMGSLCAIGEQVATGSDMSVCHSWPWSARVLQLFIATSQFEQWTNINFFSKPGNSCKLQYDLWK
jgi:hypothetical protein